MSLKTTDPLGPNLKRLLIEFMSKRTVDAATRDRAPNGYFGTAAAVAARIATNGIGVDAREAFDDLNKALDAVRAAAEPNPFKNATSEDIAGAILKRLEQRRIELHKTKA